MSDSLATWFKSEVLVHEGILMRFLARSWPNRDELADIRQEAYIRVCEAAAQALPRSPKAFLFSIAKNIMADRRRRERIVSIQAASDRDLSNDLVEEKTPDRCVDGHQELARLALAFDRLPEKCRNVVWMRRVLDIPQKEVAERLGVKVRTVEAQVFKGINMLTEYMRQSGPMPDDGRANSGDLGKKATDETHEQESP